MQNLVKAHHELFRRSPDECFPSLASLFEHCTMQREKSRTCWYPPEDVQPIIEEAAFHLQTNGSTRKLNNWSFSQLCRMAEVSKDTVNRLSAGTACQVLTETWPMGGKPFQVFIEQNLVRSIHGVTYTRLHNADILEMLAEWATDFQPPQTGATSGTGLYCGEEDMFCFLIDPTGWIDIQGEAFAPGFFIWNSEVGRRTVGIQSFWFQSVCQNHIVWDATDVTEFSRKHTRNVEDALEQMRIVVANLVEKRDSRREEFTRVIYNAMKNQIADEEAMKLLTKQGITRVLGQEALEVAREQGALTIYSIVDALTRLSQRMKFAGARAEADARASRLLALAA